LGLSEISEIRGNEEKKFLRQIDEIINKEGFPIIQDTKTGNPLWIDVRELKLRYFIPIKKTMKFFEYLTKGKLIATKCKKCNIMYFPPQDDCPKCMSSNLDYIELSGEGELVTYTIINVKPASFTHYKDYIVGIIRLKEGINILGWINVDPSEIHVGMRLRVNIVRRAPEGYYIYEFTKS
jgi:uncharacterized OB-fold protein